MIFSAAEVARQVEGTVQGEGTLMLKGVASADQAREGDLTFAENASYLERVLGGEATGVLAPRETGLSSVPAGKVLIEVANPRVALAKALAMFHPPRTFAPGVHPTAVVASTARLDPSVHVGPLCVVGDGAVLGAGTVLEGSVHVGADCVLGAGVRLFPHVTLYARTRLGDRVRVHAGAVIGSDGFGYVTDGGMHRKIPQVGNVVVGDDVEIGANVTIDRGVLGPTVIGKGSKIDNLVQIAHNVQVGEHCILLGQVGISGSTRLGDYVILAGQVGLAGHLKVGDQATIGAKSGVMHDVPAGESWLGIPAQESRRTKRQMIALQRLPELLKRVAALERERQAGEAKGLGG